MNTKKIAITLSYTLFISLCLYLIVALTFWDLNPNNWNWFARFAIGLLGIGTGSLIGYFKATDKIDN